MGNFEKLGVLVIIILAVVIMIILIGGGPQEALEPEHEKARGELFKPTPRGGGGVSSTIDREPPPVRPVDRTGEDEWPIDDQPAPPIPDDNVLPVPPPPVLEDIKHVVKKNESFYSLAKQYYGPENVKLYRKIAEANPQVSASSLGIGTVLTIPHRDKVVAGSTPRVHSGGGSAVDNSAGGDTYVVQKGDSLWKIAAKTLGRGSDFRRIQEANLDVLAGGTDVSPGMTLRIPR